LVGAFMIYSSLFSPFIDNTGGNVIFSKCLEAKLSW